MTEKQMGKANRESDPKYMRFLHEWAESRHEISYPKRLTDGLVIEPPATSPHADRESTPAPGKTRGQEQASA